MQWLQWGDVDLDNARVVVRAKKPMARGNTRMRAGHQIKDAEDRVVDLTRNAVNLLRDHMAAPCRKPTPADFVFPNDRGELMSTMSNHIWKVFKRSGIREGSANLLRHTFASMFLSSGGNLAELKRYMGHSTITITEQHYAQYLPGNESSIHRVDFGDGGLAPEHGVSRIAGVVGQGA
jgi:integrase